jgi:ABC-type uncharacterized transport system substrate-binding protein
MIAGRTFLFFLILLFGLSIQGKTIVLLSPGSTSQLKILDGFQYTFQNEFETIFFNENEEFKDKLKENISKDDLLITIGNPSTYFVRKELQNKNIFSGTSYSKENINYEKGNSCGFFSTLPAELYFQNINTLFPQVKKILVIYSDPILDQYLDQALISEMKYGILIKSIKIKDESEFKTTLENNIQGNDSIFLLGDPIITEDNFLFVSSEASIQKKLLFTNIPNLTEIGAGFSLEIEPFELGKATGSLTSQYTLGNTKCDLGPYYFPDRYTLNLNKEYLSQSGFTMSSDVERQTEIIKYNKMGKELYYKSKKNTAKNIFAYVLKMDPNNEEARNYLRIISNEGNESKISNHLANSDIYLKNKDYKNSISELAQIKKIDPSFPEIDSKINHISKLYSESKRQEAFSEENKKNHYKSIQLYNESLSIYPDNQASKTELSLLRAKLTPSIEGLFDEGSKKYNERHYLDAKVIFENILLIDPNNKKSKDFLRLSIEKKNALDKIMNCKNDKDNPCSL